MRSLRLIPSLLACVFATGAAAQYPDKPIRLIVPQAAGSATDTVARILGAELAKRARPAGHRRQPAGRRAHHRHRHRREVRARRLHASAWGRSARSRSRATWWRSCPTTSSATSSRSRWSRAATCCSRCRRMLPFKSVQELIDYAKANPGKLSNASSSNGSPGHVGGELFKYMTGTEIVHVPYRGGAAAINDLIAGRVQLMFESLNSIAPHAQLRRGAGAGGQRRAPLAGISRPADGRRGRRAGLRGADLERRDRARPACRARSSTSSTPRSTARSSRRRSRSASRAIGDEPAGGTPEEFAETIRKDSAKWGEVVRRSGAKLDEPRS